MLIYIMEFHSPLFLGWWPSPRGMYDIQDSHLRFHNFIHDHVVVVNDQLKGVRHPPAPTHSWEILEHCCSFCYQIIKCQSGKGVVFLDVAVNVFTISDSFWRP